MLFTRRSFLIVTGTGIGGCLVSSARARQHGEGQDVICSFSGLSGFGGATKVRDPSPEALHVVGWIADAVGIQPNFRVFEADFKSSPIAFASHKDGQRVIVYDSAHFTWGNGRVNWAEVGIMGHEAGHHLGGHIGLSSQSRHEEELEADRFAGVIMGRLGSSLEQALSMTKLLNLKGTKSHPPRAERIAAVKSGWYHAQAMKRREASRD